MSDGYHVMVPADEYVELSNYKDAHEGEVEELEKIVDRLKAERDKLAEDLADADKRLRQLNGDLKGARTSRDHWEHVASRHAAEIQRLKRGLKTERELTRMWPRFEDGAPVRIGDEFWWDYSAHRVDRILLYDRGFRLENEERTCFTKVYSYGEPAERPPLKAADSQPIEVGQTLYGEDGRGWRVLGIERGEKYPVTATSDKSPEVGNVVTKQLKAEWLTHERPDSWERIAEELRVGEYAYITPCKANELADRIEELAKEAGR